MPDHAYPHPDVAGYVLGTLDPTESAHFAVHLRDCDECQQEAAELASVRALLDPVMPAPAIPAGLAERTLAAVEREATGALSVLPVDPPPDRRRRPALVAALAAAAVVLVLTLAVLVSRPGGDGGRQVVLVAAGGGPGEAVATLRRTEPGIAVELVVDGLEPPPPGSYFECWYVAPGDTAASPSRLSAGTFTVTASGPTTVHMTTAADPRRFPAIEVTLEPDDGDPARTGPVVLRSRPRR